MPHVRRWLASAVSAAVLSLSVAAWAGASTDAAKARQVAIMDALKKSDAKAATANEDQLFDYDAIAEASLGPEWAARSDPEKKQFGDLLKQLVRMSFEHSMRKLLDWNVAWVGEESTNGVTLVKTKATSKADPKAEPVEITYRMKQKGSAWRAQDIITEGVSLTASYRSQFTKIIKKDGFPALIKKMKDKIAKGES